MTEKLPFWKEAPRKPFSDWRTYMIGIPVLSSAWGATLFMFLAFSFTELSAIPANVRTWIVVVAAFSSALGSAFGSIGSSVEVYSKAFEKRAERLDWISLALSVLATLGGFVLGFAALLAGAEWAVFVRLWGPIALSVLVAGDAASDVIQLGGIFGSYNLRYKQWRLEKRAYDEGQEAPAPEPVLVPAQPKPVQFDPSWSKADADDARRIFARLNGERETWNNKQLKAHLFEELVKEQLRPRSKSAVSRWVTEAKEG